MDLIACAGASARVQSSPSCAHPVAGTVAFTTTIESYKRIAFTPDGSGGTWTVRNPDGVTATYRPVTTTASGAGSDGTTALPATRVRKTPGHTTADWLPLAISPLMGLASNWPTGPAEAGRWDETLNRGSQRTLDWPTPGGHVSWLLGDLNRDERQAVLQLQPDSDGSSIDVQAEMNLDNGGSHDLISPLAFGWSKQTTSSDVANATPELADANGDGYTDLVIVARTSGGDYAGVALNQQDAQFTVAKSGVVTAVAVPDSTTGVAAGGDGFLTGDVTGNGRADLIPESVAGKSCPNSTPSLTSWLSDGREGSQTVRRAAGRCLLATKTCSLTCTLSISTAISRPTSPANNPRLPPTRARQRVQPPAYGDRSQPVAGRLTRVVDTGQSWMAAQPVDTTDGCPPPPPNKKTRCTVDADQPGVWGDFDGDHRTDLAVLTKGSPGSISAHILRSDGTGAFNPAETWATNLPNPALRTISSCTPASTPGGATDCTSATKLPASG